MNYYNEFDPYAAQWLRNLINAGHLPNGEVDSRSIKDVKASELAGFVQCHFFAGLGGWSHALRLARWPEDRPVWTGSCPCQPFSAAGAGGGVTDERHLWPTWFNLIRECRPDVIFGEQVEAAINHGWLDLVQSDLEGEGYACGAVGIPAGGVGAPHIRQRLWFVADTQSVGRSVQYTSHDGSANAPSNTLANANDSVADQRRSDIGELADANNSHQFGNRSGGGKRNKSENQRGWSNEQVDGCLSSSQLGISPSAGRRTGGEHERGVEMGGGRSTAQRGATGHQLDRTDTTDSQLADTIDTGRKSVSWDVARTTPSGNRSQRRARSISQYCDVDQLGDAKERRRKGQPLCADGNAPFGDPQATSSQLADTSNNGHLATDGLRAPVKPSREAGAHGVGQSAGSCDVDQLADTAGEGRKERQHRPGEGGREIESGECEQQPSRHGATDQLADSQREGLEGHAGDERNRNEPGRVNAQQARSVTQSSWSDCDWLPCRDGKARPVEPGTFPLAHGVSGRVGRLRAYGNAIVPQVAQTFIEAYLES